MTKSAAYTALVLCFAVALPRLAALGWYPHLDEGYYAFVAQYFHSLAAGSALPNDLSGYQLYPFLLSPLLGFSANPFVLLRLADLAVALLAGCFFCRMLVLEAGSAKFGLLLAAVFLLGLNVPQAVDSGFKNSFFAAFACLFAAMTLVSSQSGFSWRWFWAGARVAFGVLLRETFAPFALLGCIALLCKRDYSALIRFILGGISGALAITAFCMLARGQSWDIFAMYLHSGAVYSAEEARRWPKFLANGQYALLAFWPLLALAVFCGIFSIGSAKKSGGAGRGIFWLAAFALPLFEPLLKIGFVYHFSVCIPGLAGFCAWAFQRAGNKKTQPKSKNRLAVAACSIAIILMLPKFMPQLQKLPVTWQTLAVPGFFWPHELAEHSNTLLACQMLKAALPKDGKFSSSGFAFFLFPAALTLPPAYNLGDLSRAWISSGQDRENFARMLADHEPDAVAIAEAFDEHSATFCQELKDWFESNPHWRRFGIIVPDNKKNYGWLGYTIYQRATPAF